MEKDSHLSKKETEKENEVKTEKETEIKTKIKTDDGKTLYWHLKKISGEIPNDVFWSDEREKYSMDEILEKVENMAAGLGEVGVKRGMYVILRIENNLSSVIMLMALISAGVLTRIAGSSTNVLDYFNDEKYEKASCYITNENNDGWVCVSLTDPDKKIRPFNGYCEICEDDRSPAVIIEDGTGSDIQISQHMMLADLKKDAVSLNFEKNGRALCCLPMNTYRGLKFVLGGIVTGYSVIFPKNYGIKHILFCTEEFRISHICQTLENYIQMTDFANEYKTENLKTGIMETDFCSEEQRSLIESKLKIRLEMGTENGYGKLC